MLIVDFFFSRETTRATSVRNCSNNQEESINTRKEYKTFRAHKYAIVKIHSSEFPRSIQASLFADHFYHGGFKKKKKKKAALKSVVSHLRDVSFNNESSQSVKLFRSAIMSDAEATTFLSLSHSHFSVDDGLVCELEKLAVTMTRFSRRRSLPSSFDESATQPYSGRVTLTYFLKLAH